MKRIALLPIVVFTLSACDKPKPATVEETILTSAFAMFVAAEVYDDVCNKTDPKSRYDMNIAANFNRIGNEQLLAGRIGDLMHDHNPRLSVDQGTKRLIKMHDKIAKKFKGVLESQGCESNAALKAKKALYMFQENHPAIFNSFLDKQIAQQGGLPTSPASVESKIDEEQ